MKRKGWSIVVLSLVILIVVTALVFLNREKPFEANRTLYDFKDMTVVEIRIAAADHEVSFIKTQGVWEMVSPKRYSIDTTVVRRLDNRLRDFLAARILEEKTADLSQYGLDSPSALISFRLNDSTEHQLLVGEKTASKLQYYAKDSAKDTIYVLGSYDIDNFLLPISDFRNRTILMMDVESINTIAMTNGEVLDFKIIGEDKAWKVSEPLQIDARSDAVYELLHDISQLVIQDFISEDGSGREAYGLAQPNFVLEIGDTSGRTQTFYFGKIDEEQKIAYLMIDDRGEIFSLSLEAFDPRRFSIGTLLDEAPLSISVQGIQKVTIAEGDKVVKFSRDPSAEDIIFLYAGQPVSEENFYALYVNIMALSAEGYDTGNAGGSPELTVILQDAGSAGTIAVDFYQRDELTYFFTVNGEAKPFYVSARKVDLVKWWRDKVLEDP